MENRTISSIYDAYKVPDGLRRHMLRVAGVGELIADHWSGPALRVSEMLRVLLLHDIGNVVKIDPEDASAASIRTAYERKYGSDDHVASQRIADEVGLRPHELELMDGKIFVKNDETAESSDYTRKVAAYADQRVAPQGVQNLMDRLMEAKERYRGKPGSSMNNPRTGMLIACAQEIERQVMMHCTLEPAAISDDAIAPYVVALATFEL